MTRLIDPTLMVGFVLAALAALLTIEGGIWVGARRRRASEHEQEGPVGQVVGATMGLLAFILAFTFGVTVTHFGARRALLLEETNAIGTAYLRAGLLRSPHDVETRALLREYTDIRVNLPGVVRDRQAFDQALARSVAIHSELWSHVRAIVAVDRDSVIDGLFIAALNELIDLHTKRFVTATQYRVPPVVWAVLTLVSVLAMGAVGFQFGLNGHRSPYASLVLALAFSAIFALIWDLDHAQSGSIRVSHQPMIELQQSLRADWP